MIGTFGRDGCWQALKRFRMLLMEDSIVYERATISTFRQGIRLGLIEFLNDLMKCRGVLRATFFD